MRSVFAAVAIILTNLISAPLLYAQETIISVGTAGNITATNSLAGNTSTESISTAQVDGVLRVVAPGLFGQNFTRDKANKVFADLANLRTGLATSLRQTIASQSNIRQVYSVTVNTNAVNLRLAQKTNSVSGELGSLSTRVSLLSDVDGFKSIFCPSVNVTFDVKNIKAFGDYNYISGDISGALVTYDLVIVSASCNGLLGGLFNPTSAARSQINSAIQDQINTQIGFVNMQRLFSLADFANGLDRFRGETIVSPILDRPIRIFQEMVNNAAINTPGIVLDFGVELGSPLGSPNRIKIIASHVPTDYGLVRRTLAMINVTVPPNSQRVDLYVKQTPLQNWQYMGSTTDGFFTVPPNFVNPNTGGPDWTYIAVARSALIGGLESFPFLLPIQPYPGGPGR